MTNKYNSNPCGEIPLSTDYASLYPSTLSNEFVNEVIRLKRNKLIDELLDDDDNNYKDVDDNDEDKDK